MEVIDDLSMKKMSSVWNERQKCNINLLVTKKIKLKHWSDTFHVVLNANSVV